MKKMHFFSKNHAAESNRSKNGQNRHSRAAVVAMELILIVIFEILIVKLTYETDCASVATTIMLIMIADAILMITAIFCLIRLYQIQLEKWRLLSADNPELQDLSAWGKIKYVRQAEKKLQAMDKAQEKARKGDSRDDSGNGKAD